TLGRQEGPVLLPFRSLLNPASQEHDLFCAEAYAMLLRRHALGLVACCYSPVQLAVLGLARNENAPAAQIRERSLLGVQSQVRLAASLVGTVAGETGVGKDGPDVAIELHARRSLSWGERGPREERAHHQRADPNHASSSRGNHSVG